MFRIQIVSVFVSIMLATPAAAMIDLGSAKSFAVLAGSTVTSAGATVITGSLGVSPGTATVPPAVIMLGALHAGDPLAAAAHADLGTAFAAVVAAPGAVDLTGQDLGGLVLTPGVYRFATSAQLTGTLYLDARGDPGANFLFQIGSTLTTASDSAVDLLGGGQAGHVFYAVGSSATLGTGTHFAGSLLAQASITLNDGARVDGRVLARDAAVTLVRNIVTVPTDAGAVPEPAQWMFFVGGFGIVGLGLRRRRSPLPFA